MTSCDTLHDGATVVGREGGCNDDDDGQGVLCLQPHSCMLNTTLCRDELYTRQIPR